MSCRPMSITAKKLFLLIICIWTVVAASSLFWNYLNGQEAAKQLALSTARSSYNKDILFRQWVSSHGGVYTPVTTRTPPNPYLTQIEKRDIVTTHGDQLTLMNPAYMMRQLTTEFSDHFPLRTHITSLKPINPTNKADSWEQQALEQLDRRSAIRSDDEIYEFDNGSEAVLRYLRPMIVNSPCLKCHQYQGYSLNDVGGAISVYVPMQPYFASQLIQFKKTLYLHLLIWLVIPGAVYPFYRSLVKETKQRNQLNLKLTALNKSLDEKVTQRTKEIEKMATTDTLTGLNNRRLLHDSIASELRRARRHKKLFVMVMFDLDNFKKYNDRYGHQQGDQVLQVFAEIVKDSMRRPDDLAFRMGGEEFLISYTVNACDGFDKITDPATRIQTTLQQQAIPLNKDVVTVSAGLTYVEPDVVDADFEELYKQADNALYLAKNKGRNQLRVYQSSLNGSSDCING